jgi:phage repressor protein C with HTH and peptisase S24 domain
MIDKPLILNKIKSHLNIKYGKDFAEFLGIKESTLSMWYKRETYDIELLFKKCEFLNPEWLLTGKGSMLKEVSTVKAVASENGLPLLPYEAFAGIGDADVAGVDFRTIEERYVVPLFDGIQIDFMLSVRGSSMYPKYNSGDVVACRLVKDLLFIQWNKVYVLDTHTQGVVMKRLKKSEAQDHVICKSDNPSYDPFELPRSEIRNIALVVGVIRLE